jgi:hypothetical protein
MRPAANVRGPDSESPLFDIVMLILGLAAPAVDLENIQP